MFRRLPVAVLASGQGTNLVALADAARRGAAAIDIRLVLSDRPAAPVLKRARELALATRAISPDDYPDRAGYEVAIRAAVESAGAELIVLAGFMRILSAEFVANFAGRIVNIHPSLLPELPGLDTHARALAAGARRHGASVHFVTAALDAGPLIAQAEVAVLAGDDADTLAARVHTAEHVLYPKVLHWYAQGRLECRGDAVWFDGRRLSAPLRVAVADGDGARP